MNCDPISRQICRLSEVAEVTSAKRIFAADYVSSGIPFFRGKEITELHRGALEVSTDLFITTQKYLDIKERHGAPQPGDLLLTSVGTLGSVYLVKPGDQFYFKDGNVTWFRHLKSVTGAYLRYWMLSPDGRSELGKCVIGSSQSAYTIDNLRKMQIRLPPLETQDRIVSILQAYDDLIEVNLRRAAVLEKMARGLFEEWFVRFRFPGHESMPVFNASEGSLPDGWQMTKVGSVLEKIRRPEKVKKQDYAASGTIPCIDQGSDFIGGYTDNIDALISGPLPMCVFGDHTRILKFITFPFASGADGTQLLYPIDGLSPEYLYLSLLNVDLSNQHYARHFKFLKEQTICLPSSEVVERFTQFVRPALELVQGSRMQNQKLAASRDLLLPRLISGQLVVEDAERELEEAA